MLFVCVNVSEVIQFETYYDVVQKFAFTFSTLNVFTKKYSQKENSENANKDDSIGKQELIRR